MFEDINPNFIACHMLTKHNSILTRQSYGKRVAKYYELELIDDGEGEIITDGCTIKAKPSRLFIRKPGMELEGIAPYFSHYLIFSLDTPHDIDKLNFPLYIDSMEHLRPLFELIRKENFSQYTTKTLVIKSSILNILSEIINHLHKYDNYNLKRVQNYIHNNYSFKITTEYLAQLCGYSVNYFSFIFKRQTNFTPIEYINNFRINKACQLIEETTKTFEEISLQCGFCNLSYFYRKFKSLKGKTPSEYKMMIHDRKLYSK